MSIDKIRGEHFLEVPPETSTRVCLERMRDEGCTVALITGDGQTRAIDAAVVQALVLGQPSNWELPAGNFAVAVPALPADSPVDTISAQLKQLVVLTRDGKAVKVVSRAGWLGYLNVTRNTAVFNPDPSKGAAR